MVNIIKANTQLMKVNALEEEKIDLVGVLL